MSVHLKDTTAGFPTGTPKRSRLRSATLISAVAVFAIIGLLTVWVLLRPANDTSSSTTVPVPVSGAAGGGGSVLTPTGFGAPTSDMLGRREETPLDAAGAFLPQTASPSTGDWSAPPAGLVWENVYGMPMPFSTSDGPTGITSDGIPVGFAHTPQGAALFAFHIGTRVLTAPGNTPQVMAASLYLAQTDTARRNLARALTVHITPDQAHQWFAITVGVKVTAYTGDYCQVHVASPVINGQPIDHSIDLAWRDGTWKIVVPDSLPLPENQRTLASLAGWNTQW